MESRFTAEDAGKDNVGCKHDHAKLATVMGGVAAWWDSVSKSFAEAMVKDLGREPDKGECERILITHLTERIGG